MVTNTSKYFRKRDIDPNCLKSLEDALGCRKRQIRVVGRCDEKVKISDIIDFDNKHWKNFYWMYRGVLRRYEKKGRKIGFSDTALWKHEFANAPDGAKHKVRERFDELFALYDSIKKHGYKNTKRLVKLMDISGLEVGGSKWGGRISKRYYRLTGMKRCIICKYMGIEKIKCRILKIKRIQL